MRYGMSYIHETIWKGVPKFLRRVDTALKNIGIDERLPYNVPLIQFCSWMGGDRDGTYDPSPVSVFRLLLMSKYVLISGDFLVCVGNPRVTPEVTRDVCYLSRMMAANLYFYGLEELMFEVRYYSSNWIE